MPVFGFSVGDIRVDSAFGEKFKAEIPLKLRLDEVDREIKVLVENNQVYQRLKLTYPNVITHLKTHIEGKAQIRRIVLYSDVPFRAPFFDLLLKTSVGRGSYTRNYPVLLEMAQRHKKPTINPPLRPQQILPPRREGPSSQPKKRPIQSQHYESIPPLVGPDYDLHLTVAEERGLASKPSSTVDSDDSLLLQGQLASLQQRLERLEQLSVVPLQPKETPESVFQSTTAQRPPVVPTKSGILPPPSADKVSEQFPWLWYSLSGLSGFVLAGFLAWLSRKKVGRTGYPPQAEPFMNRPPERAMTTLHANEEPFIQEGSANLVTEAEKKWRKPQEKRPPEKAHSISNRLLPPEGEAIKKSSKTISTSIETLEMYELDFPSVVQEKQTPLKHNKTFPVVTDEGKD